jgi:hypothetical protein
MTKQNRLIIGFCLMKFDTRWRFKTKRYVRNGAGRLDRTSREIFLGPRAATIEPRRYRTVSRIQGKRISVIESVSL